MKHKILIAIFTLGLALTPAFLRESEISGQRASSSTLNSFEKAHSIVENSLRAMGFDRSKNDLKSLAFEFEGDIYWRHQGKKLLPPYDSTPFKGTVVYDIANSRLAFERNTDSPDGFKNHRRDVREKKGGFNADFNFGRIQELPNSSPEDLRYVLDRLPHLVLRRILEQPAALRWVGKMNFKDRPHNVVTALFRNTTANFYFDEKTKLLSKYEVLIFDVFEGDVVQERIFDGYRSIKNVMFPSVLQQRVADTLNQNYRYVGVEIDSPVDENFFKPPALPKSAENAGSGSKVSEIAPGVFYLEGVSAPYTQLFVEFADHIAVVDAPVNSAVAEQSIEIIKKTIPNKPIRYIIPTHHHDDHAGGLRAFVAEGATILTTPHNKTFFEAMMRAKYISQPDRLSAAPRPAKIEVVKDGKLVLSDEKQKLELYDIGPNHHSDEMLIAYLPGSGLVFQADLWGVPMSKTAVVFASWLKKSRLPVQWIYGAHEPKITLKEMEEVISKQTGLK